MQLALCTGERRDRASRAWKVGSWANQRARCFTLSQKLPWQRKLLQATVAMLSESQLAMLRKEPSVSIICNISSSPGYCATPQTLKPGKKLCRWKSSSYNIQYQYTNLLVSPEIGPKPETSGSSVSLAILSARG